MPHWSKIRIPNKYTLCELTCPIRLSDGHRSGLFPGASHFKHTLLSTLPETQNANLIGLQANESDAHSFDRLLKIHRCLSGRFFDVADETVWLV